MMMSEEEKIEYLNSFPPGWRFVPTEEELIVEYLKKKLQNAPLPTNQIKDVHLYDHNPWELTENFTSYGENEYYFFSPRDRKYPKGSRPNRGAGIGYWKATGKVKRVCDSNGVDIGSKSVLVFYEKKQPKGNKTPWVMHEYTANDEDDERTTDARAGTRSANGGDMQLDEWVLCKIYKRREEEPAATPETPAALETPAEPETPVAPAPAAAAENHLNIIQVENSATREENTTRSIYPGSDIYYGQDMFYFGRPNGVERHQEDVLPIEYREEQNYEHDIVNVVQAENREENTTRNIYPGSDIYYDQDMFLFGRSNEVSFLEKGEERHQEDLSSIEYREEQNYEHDMVNVVQAENTTTREENTTRNIYPGSDIYYDQDMFLFGRSNEVSFLEKGEERHQEDLSSIEYREEQNYDQDMFNADDLYLAIPPGIGSSEMFDP